MTEYKLLVACYKGELVEVQKLLPQVRNAADIRDSWWWEDKTLLHYSCHHSWLDMTRKLVEQYRCNPESRDKDGEAPLHVACRKGHVEIVRYLVSEKGCCKPHQNSDGDSPLHVACREGHLAMVKALTSGQDCKAACNCQNNDGDTPLHEACQGGHVDIVRYLVSEKGCSTAYQNCDGSTPLHMACREGHLDMVKILLSTGRVDPWCKNASNQTPVQLTHNYAISKLFAELGKDLVTGIKVFIFGNPAADKSTLVKVIENKVACPVDLEHWLASLEMCQEWS